MAVMNSFGPSWRRSGEPLRGMVGSGSRVRAACHFRSDPKHESLPRDPWAGSPLHERSLMIVSRLGRAAVAGRSVCPCVSDRPRGRPPGKPHESSLPMTRLAKWLTANIALQVAAVS